MEYERVREQIAFLLCELEDRRWNDLTVEETTVLRRDAAQILSLDGIEIRVDDQSLPENKQPEAYWVTHPHFETAHDAVMEAQDDVLKADSEGKHWVKVLPKPFS